MDSRHQLDHAPQNLVGGAGRLRRGGAQQPTSMQEKFYHKKTASELLNLD